MEVSEALRFLQEQIHTTVAATVDSDGRPVTCAIDIMDTDEDSLYFLTAKGKGFYNRLKQSGCIALTGIRGEDTMTSVAVSVSGKAEEIGESRLPRLFEKNPYMREIYPTEESRKALTVFRISDGKAEWFDLSKKPIERFSFTFGHALAKEDGYFITESCIGCGTCLTVCPQSCIELDRVPALIRQEHCLRCGNCMGVCPVNAVIRKS